MVDFSLLGGQPNYLAIYKQSYDTSKQAAKDERVANALQTAGKDLATAESELIGLGAFDEASQLRAIRRDQARKKAAEAARLLDYGGAAAAAAEVGDVELADQYGARGRAAELGGLVASGDYAGARGKALASGDFDVASQIGKLDDAQRAKISERNDTFGSIAYSLAQVPYEKRRPAIQSILPQLKAQGFTDEEIAQVANADPTDENLKAVISQALSLKEAIDLAKPKLRTVGDGGVVFDDETGKPVFENKKTFAPPRASSSASPSSGLPPGYEPVR